jgi:hypothetical protein
VGAGAGVAAVAPPAALDAIVGLSAKAALLALEMLQPVEEGRPRPTAEQALELRSIAVKYLDDGGDDTVDEELSDACSAVMRLKKPALRTMDPLAVQGLFRVMSERVLARCGFLHVRSSLRWRIGGVHEQIRVHLEAYTREVIQSLTQFLTADNEAPSEDSG